MKKGTTIPLILFLLLFQILPLTALSAEFNPDYLISDEEMQDYQSMTRSDIDVFLKEKDSYLSLYRAPDKDGKKRKASDIIWRAAEEYRINPKYLLVKLQKEQSLITDPDPTQKQLDWATGYGVCDACSMNDPKIQKYKGFGNQIDSAAGIIRWYYDNADEQTWIKSEGNTYTIDGQSVRPQNNATAFLYTYTPHIQGNQNFWKLWQKWFETGYPDGTVFKSPEDPTIYLLQDGKKRAFKNMTALITRVDPKRVLVVPSIEISRYPTGVPIHFPNFSLLKVSDTYYLLDNDTLRPFDSALTVQKIGYNPDEILEVSRDDIAEMDIGSTITAEEGTNPFGEIIFIKETGSLYFIKDGVSHTIIDPKIATIAYPNIKSRNGKLEEIEKVKAGEPLKFPDGTLIKVPSSPKIYVIEHGKKRHIASEKMFLALGYKWENVITTNDLVSTLFPIGSPIALPESVTEEFENNNIPVSNSVQNASTSTTKISDVVTLGKDGLPKFIDTGIMYGLKDENSTFVGKKFDTTINTYLIAEAKSGRIVAGKNIDVVRPLASFTKVMTADILMKKNISLSKTVTYKNSEHKGMYGSYRLVDGEKVTNKDIFTTMLVSSNNSAARMIVDGIEKDEAKFVEAMNAQALALGLQKTRFTDPSGANLGNISTAREYLTIFQDAIKNPTTLSVLGQTSYSYEEVIDKDNNRAHFDSHSNILTKRTDLPYTIVASKTGYLIESGSGLAMLVERKSDKKRFFIVVMGDPEYAKRFDNANALTQWALKTY